MLFKAHKLIHRQGLILCLKDNKNRLHFTEISPLIGFSQESFAEVKTEMLTLLSSRVCPFFDYKSAYPSVQFALDSLFYAPQEQQLNIDKIPLLQGSSYFINDQYQALNRPNLIKLKVAREEVESDICNFQLLCQLNPDLKIRCDANQAWSIRQAELFFSSIDIKRLDYIEEPTQHHQTNLYLAEKYQFKLALDETLQQPSFHYHHHACIKALIIKPTLVGGKKQIDQLISLAKKYALQVSFSSSFESALGLQQIKNLALHYQAQHPISLGIDTLKYFTGTLLLDETQIQKDCSQLEHLCTQQY